MDIVSLPLEVRVFADVGHDIKIARGAAQNSRIALAMDSDPRAGIDSGGYSYLDRLSCRYDSFSPAVGAWRPHFTGTPAFPALRHTPGATVLRLAVSLTVRASDFLASLFAGRGTGRADLVVFNFKSFRRAVNGVLKRYSQRILDDGAPLRLHPGCGLAANPAE